MIERMSCETMPEMPRHERRPIASGGAIRLAQSVVLLLVGCDGTAERVPTATFQPAAAEQFCLAGEFDLGLRLQGMTPEPGEFYPVRFCVVTATDGERVHFSATGRSNPDISGDFAITYLPPDRVRLPGKGDAPDIEFVGAGVAAEARRNRRIDPRRLAEDLRVGDGWTGLGNGWYRRRIPGGDDLRVRFAEGRVQRVEAVAELPLRGRVPVIWRWDWPAAPAGEPAVVITVDGEVMLRARGERRSVPAAEAEALWRGDRRQPAREIPGADWPAAVDMQLETLAEGVHRVTGVRTGFHHLVVETAAGLVIADAPAGWVELHQLPPFDLVPGLGVSGLSERLIDFLRERFPDAPLRAVALTHAHDDHAGGARAFAAAGADVYAPASVADWLEAALNRPEMPEDRLAETGGRVDVIPVGGVIRLDDTARPVEMLELPSNPHVSAALGIRVPDAGIFFESDLHVPGHDTATLRPDRAATECWFARWAVAHLPEDTVVFNSHSRPGTPLAHLRGYTAHPHCSGGRGRAGT